MTTERFSRPLWTVSSRPHPPADLPWGCRGIARGALRSQRNDCLNTAEPGRILSPGYFDAHRSLPAGLPADHAHRSAVRSAGLPRLRKDPASPRPSRARDGTLTRGRSRVSPRRPPAHRSGAAAVPGPVNGNRAGDVRRPAGRREEWGPEVSPTRAGMGSTALGHGSWPRCVRRTAVLRRGHDVTRTSRSAGVCRHVPGRRRSVGVVKTAADPPAGPRPAHANDEDSTIRQTGTTQ